MDQDKAHPATPPRRAKRQRPETLSTPPRRRPQPLAQSGAEALEALIARPSLAREVARQWTEARPDSLPAGARLALHRWGAVSEEALLASVEAHGHLILRWLGAEAPGAGSEAIALALWAAARGFDADLKWLLDRLGLDPGAVHDATVHMEDMDQVCAQRTLSLYLAP